MILYNVTLNVDDDIHEEWLKWMTDIHIPNVLETGLFIGNRMFKMLSKHIDEKGTTYSVQYYLADMDDFSEYQTYHAPLLQQEHTQRYGGKVVAFRTLLEEVA